MENKGLLSVVVTVHNNEKYIEKCLSSIISSDYSNIEIIVVDNNSSDNTGVVCSKYTNEYPFIKYIKAADKEGPSYARNIGLSHCNGFYVSFVDGDDYVDNSFFTNLIQSMNNNNTDIEIGRFEINHPNGDKGYKKSGPDYLFRLDDNYDSFAYYAHRSVCGCVFKKELLNGIKFNEDIFIGEDLLFFTRALMKSKLCHYSSKDVYYHYVQHDDSIYNKVDYQKQYTNLVAHKRVVECFKRQGLRKATKIAKKYYCYKCYDLINQLNKETIATRIKIKLRTKCHMISLLPFIIVGREFSFRFFIKWLFLLIV